MDLDKCLAGVAPRVTRPDGGEPVRLLDQVDRMLTQGITGAFNLYGPAGCGKTTALCDLAAAFSDRHLRLLDGKRPGEKHSRQSLLIFTTKQRTSDAAMGLVPWTRDEWIEYLLARRRDRCGSVMPRVLADPHAHHLAGIAQLWSIVLDEMSESDASDIRGALRHRAGKLALSPQRHADAAARCVSILTRQLTDEQFAQSFLPAENEFFRLLRHRTVQLLLASDMLVYWLCDVGNAKALEGIWPAQLITETAQQLKQRNGVAEILESVLEGNDLRLHPVAASLLLALEPSWRPAARYVPNLASAQLRNARWQHVDLFRARLPGCDLRNADLRDARLQQARATRARLFRADLRGALMQSIDAERVDFAGANLSGAAADRAQFGHAELEGANLQRARLRKAHFLGANLRQTNFKWANLRNCNFTHATLEGADFSGADLTKAVFSNAPLYETSLAGARLHKAWLVGCNLEDMDLAAIDLSGANLAGALLTGASMAGANLRRSILRKTGLAHVDLQGADLRSADLRGASFHFGSTRSGLVGSVIPCEGSRTGFYTDEFEEQTFRRPEDLRKANLTNADLRGANIKRVDFYLVDLRGARYTRRQAKYFRRCGAILD